jgi:hypothetical protein
MIEFAKGNITISAYGAVILLLIAVILIAAVVAYYKLRPTESKEVTMLSYLVVPILIIGVLGFLLKSFDQSVEVQVGFLIVIAIIALITLLFIVAAAFSKLNLTDPKQALGLPEGSIRAMIALMLIMVFIIFGIFIFRFTARGNEAGPARMTIAQLNGTKNVSAIAPALDEHKNVIQGEYDVWVNSELPPDTMRLATQLLTTVGTLVVAVAGFYFGSSAVSSAVAAVREVGVSPTISSVNPTEGKQSTEVPITITGRNFQMPRSVRLTRGSDEMFATDVMASGGRITAKVKLDKAAGGDSWDVVVQNEGGADARLEKSFKITP